MGESEAAVGEQLFADFQYEIYLGGMSGAVPRLPTDLTRLEELTEPSDVERAACAGQRGCSAGRRAGRPRTSFRRW